MSFKVREGLQRSIDESRMLSISVLAEQSSMLEEMDLAGLAEEEDVEQEEWTVPDVDLDDLVGEDDLAVDEAIQAKEAAERKLLAMEAEVKLLLLSNREAAADDQLTRSGTTKRVEISRSRARRTRSVGGLSLKRKEKEGRKATSLPVQVKSLANFDGRGNWNELLKFRRSLILGQSQTKLSLELGLDFTRIAAVGEEAGG